jgi:hypothetical protein
MNDEVQTLFLELADLAPAERARYFDCHQVNSDVRPLPGG